MMAPRKQTKKNANGEGGIYRRPDGRWETKLFVDTPDGQRKRISVYVTSEREALNELNKLRDQQRRGIPIATTTLTVADYMAYWLEHIAEPGIRRTTYATYEGTCVCTSSPVSASGSSKPYRPPRFGFG
jgi:hypothetical protein